MTVILSLGCVLLVAGVVGLVIPIIPGTVLLFFGSLAIAYSGEFEVVGYASLSIIFALMILSQVLEYIAGPAKAKQAGASRLATFGAFIGGIFGIFFGLPGIVLGPIIGAVVGELVSRRDLLQAQRIGFATLWGIVIGVAL